jgi:hypothetical protein
MVEVVVARVHSMQSLHQHTVVKEVLVVVVMLVRQQEPQAVTV